MNRALKVILTSLLLSQFASAETLIIPVASQGEGAAVATPRKSETQQSVRERFGEPQKAHATIGQPPITRWDYSNFSVYFEYERVITAVVKHRPQAGQ